MKPGPDGRVRRRRLPRPRTGTVFPLSTAAMGEGSDNSSSDASELVKESLCWGPQEEGPATPSKEGDQGAVKGERDDPAA